VIMAIEASTCIIANASVDATITESVVDGSGAVLSLRVMVFNLVSVRPEWSSADLTSAVAVERIDDKSKLDYVKPL